MKLRNNVFVEAFDYLKRNTDIKTQKELARRMGVTDNTITRIMRGYTDVTEDVITKLQTASGCIFNIQWLRGEDPIHMLIEDLNDGMVAHFLPPEDEERNAPIDHSSLVNAALAAKDETIASLKRELATKDEIIETKNQRINDLEKLAEERLHRIAELRRIIDANSMMDYPFPVGTADPQDNTEPMRV